MTKILNLTPHDITFVNENNETILTIEPCGQIARVEAYTVVTGEINGIPVTHTEFGEITDLPEPTDGVIYVVSSQVAGRCKERTDVFIPNESIRNEKGNIIGCRSLGHI